MHWLVLVVSAAFEAVWATALGLSNGLRRPLPTAVFVVGMLISVAGLAYAMTGLPPGTCYAVWVAVGAALTIVVAVLRGQERLTWVRGVLLSILVGCVIGLKVVA